jgi:hypothetical protein
MSRAVLLVLGLLFRRDPILRNGIAWGHWRKPYCEGAIAAIGVVDGLSGMVIGRLGNRVANRVANQVANQVANRVANHGMTRFKTLTIIIHRSFKTMRH